jgi:hypothetical protein
MDWRYQRDGQRRHYGSQHLTETNRMDNKKHQQIRDGSNPPPDSGSNQPSPYHVDCFRQMGVIDTWKKYGNVLTWGKGQCLAILDDGCDLTDPPWQTKMAWGPKVIATYNSIENNDDPTPVSPGYHGTSVGYPSSLKHQGVYGVAYNNSVAQVRCVTIVHLQNQDEAPALSAGLQWVLDQHEKYHITAVNLSPLDDERHASPCPSPIDQQLLALREQGIWVSAPCGNHHYTDGISWPACQPFCFAIGATIPRKHEVHLDRYSNTDLLVAAEATSSSNAYAAACAMILREAIEITDYPWPRDGDNIAEAMLQIFKMTGFTVKDDATGCQFTELNLLSAVDHVFTHKAI